MALFETNNFRIESTIFFFLDYHPNVINFDECYLQTESKIVPMRSIRDIKKSKQTQKDSKATVSKNTATAKVQSSSGQPEEKVSKAYLKLLEASLKGESVSYRDGLFVLRLKPVQKSPV